MGEPSDVLASDAERDEVVQRLAAHAAVGRLTMAELELRTEGALRASTRGALTAMECDLPAVSEPRLQRPEPTTWQVALMGHSDKVGRWRVAARLTSIAVMGGLDLDLRGAEFDGSPVTIFAFALMGGIDIYLPDSVDVQIDGFALMGGNDDRGARRPARAGAPMIRIKAFAVMGGIDVWRVPQEAATSSRSKARKAAKSAERYERHQAPNAIPRTTPL